MCLNCHQDHSKGIARDKMVAWFSHPAKQIVLRSDKDRMPLLYTREEDAGFGAIGCATCHDPHVWTPKHRGAKSSPLARNAKNLEGDPYSSFPQETAIRIRPFISTVTVWRYGKNTSIFMIGSSAMWSII